MATLRDLGPVKVQVSEHTKAWVDSLPNDVRSHVMERASRGLLMTIASENIDKVIEASQPKPQLKQGETPK